MAELNLNWEKFPSKLLGLRAAIHLSFGGFLFLYGYVTLTFFIYYVIGGALGLAFWLWRLDISIDIL